MAYRSIGLKGKRKPHTSAKWLFARSRSFDCSHEDALADPDHIVSLQVAISTWAAVALQKFAMFVRQRRPHRYDKNADAMSSSGCSAV